MGQEQPEAAALAAFRQSLDMVLVVEGPELRVVTANDALTAFFAGKELIGASLYESFSELLGQQVLDVYAACLETGEPQVAREWRVRYELPAGPVERWFDFATFPWRDGDGSVRGVIGRGIDVTDSVLAARDAQRRHEASEGRYRQAQSTVIALQDALLPQELPVVSGLDVAATYLLATEETAAGGDWFDALVRPDGRVALVVGDVVGHGVTASAVMGQLRAVLHESLLSGADLGAALRDVDRFARSGLESRATTICVVLVDPSSGAIEYVTAGHPPPLVVGVDGTPRFLEATGAGPLAAGPEAAPRTAELGPDELVLLYSDGLVERPGRTVSQQTVDLLQVSSSTYLDRTLPTSATHRTVERVCVVGLELLTRLTGYADDVTMLAAQRVPEIAPLHVRVPARNEAVRTVREELSRWLQALEVRALDEVAVQHGIGELVANVVEHAYADRSADEPEGEVVVSAELGPDGHLAAEVVDTGRWLTPRSQPGGSVRGLGMVGQLLDELRLERGPDGTRATVRLRLSRPARLLTGREVTSTVPPPGGPEEFSVDLAGPVVRVGGAVDLEGVGQLPVALRQVGRGGAGSGVVDLSGVTHLGSAGVQALYENAGPHLTLVAPPGSVAQHVLELVRLPYVATPPGTDDEPTPDPA